MKVGVIPGLGNYKTLDEFDYYYNNKLENEIS